MLIFSFQSSAVVDFKGRFGRGYAFDCEKCRKKSLFHYYAMFLMQSFIRVVS